jgi:hypothetical protein
MSSRKVECAARCASTYGEAGDALRTPSIGASAVQSAFAFAGTIDEIRISRVARYESAQFVPQRRFSADADAIALFHLDEGSGDTADDVAGGHRGQVSGAGWLDAPCE